MGVRAPPLPVAAPGSGFLLRAPFAIKPSGSHRHAKAARGGLPRYARDGSGLRAGSMGRPGGAGLDGSGCLEGSGSRARVMPLPDPKNTSRIRLR